MGNNIRKNYIYNVSFQIFSLLTPLITAPYISRVLGPTGTGTYSYIHSIATYFSLMAALGLTSYGLREASRVRDNPKRASRIFYELMVIRVVTTIISFLLYMGFVWLTGGDMRLYLGTGFIILAVGVDATWFFQAKEKFKALMIRNFLIKFVSIVCIFLFVKTADDLLIYTIIQTGSIFLSNLVLLPQLRGQLVPTPWRKLRFGRHMKETLAYFVTTIATSIYTVLDRTMIGMLTHDMAQNGYYEQAHKIVNILLTVITSLNVVVGVRTSYLFGQNKQEEIRTHVRDTFRFMYMLSFPLCAGLIACAQLFSVEFFGREFEAVGPMLMMFAPLLFTIGVSNVLDNLYMTPAGRRGHSNRAIITGACTNVALNLLLIPRFGAYGAVVASVLAEVVISAMFLRYSHRFISAWQLLGMALRYAAFAGVMFLPTYFLGQVLPPRATTILVQIAVGVIVYAALLILFRDPAWLACKEVLRRKLQKSPTPNEE